ncbi:hypothetical protein HPB51_011174 [Rhipicephalus microplus]|uniref:Fibrinogen C-terminal domain-containing protein n=1 Tax=Rhipicephalus microplus TaxID=6941 RepID=A0A9J6F129_RHIMP|nr:hypothetical protein HPB51_011174 [Rhipicephalus microplus]
MMANCFMIFHVLVLASIIRVYPVEAEASSVISGGSAAAATAATAAATAPSAEKTAPVLEKPFDNAEEKVKELESILHYIKRNEALNAMTSGKRDMTLRIVLRNTTSDKVSIYYSKFRVSNGAKMYQLEMGNFIGPQGWDAMRHADGQKFSTYDQDNDVSTYNCAEQYRGAWWYSDCHACNPNGLNLNGYHESYGDGIEWSIREHTGKLYYYSYPYMEMMIRPARLLEGKEKDLKFFPKQ